MAGNFAVWTLINGAREGEPTGCRRWIGFQDEALKTGQFGIQFNSGDVAKKPLADGAQRVVVEGIHAGVKKAVLMGPAIPALPDGGGAVFYGVKPGGVIIAEKKAVGDIGVSRERKLRVEVGDADEAGGEMPVEVFNVVDERAARVRTISGRRLKASANR